MSRHMTWVNPFNRNAGVRCAGGGRWTDDTGTPVDNAPACSWAGTRKPPDWCTHEPEAQLADLLDEPCPRCGGRVELIQGGAP
jgi:hypothetical protein